MGSSVIVMHKCRIYAFLNASSSGVKPQSCLYFQGLSCLEAA